MEELKNKLEELAARLKQIQIKLDPSVREKAIRDLEAKSMQPDFWSDSQSAQASMKRLASLQAEHKEIAELEQQIHDSLSMIEIVDEKEVKKLDKKLNQLELKTYLNGPYDSDNAILSIHAGQGGTEAMDWAAMLLRMYLRFCESRDWQHYVGGDGEAGAQPVGVAAGTISPA
jgi:peptide chain release factor 2